MTADPVLLTAPLTGVIVPIEEVPDPVFAQKMVGDGFSLYPMDDVLRAPVPGEVAHIHDARHAVTVRSVEGLEVLMHIGLDTVSMGGAGFDVRVAQGQQVQAGDALVAFDLAAVRAQAASVLTQVVIANGELVERIETMTGTVVGGEDVAAMVHLAPGEAEAAPADGGATVAGGEAGGTGGAGGAGGAGAAAAAVGAVVVGAAAGAVARSAAGADESPAVVEGERILVPNPTGLHARPAATLVGLAKDFESDVQLRSGEESANAKSIIAVMALGLAHGTSVQVVAAGADAQAAVTAITQAIREGLGEDVPDLPQDAPAPAPSSSAPLTQPTEPVEPVREAPRSGDPDLLLGVAASPGVGIGQVVQIRAHVVEVDERGAGAETERAALTGALQRAHEQLTATREDLADQPDKAEIFAAHQEILDDPELLDLAQVGIDAGQSAGFAWRAAFESYANTLAGLDNEVLAGRANDVRDVGGRVLEEITGQRRERRELAEGSVLVARDLTPSDTAALDPAKVAGFATVAGGASSHVAIIARSLGIPAVAGVEARALDLVDGTRVVLDGSAGSMRLNVSEDELDRTKERRARIAAKREADMARAFDPATTLDGHTVEVVANIGNVADAQQAMTVGAEGVGLLRSEFMFMDRPAAPSEDEQAEVYAEIARSLEPGQPLVIRTLDVGGDKPLPYLPIEHEENPFLGIRGVRVGLEQPEVLRTQVRAILRAADAGAKLAVMFPMIATLEDFRAAKAIFDAEAAGLGMERSVPLGIMVEVPSVAVMARQFAREADFFSVGTNDLTSYTLAMDRGHPKLASQMDPCSPAVLALIGLAAAAAHREGKWLGVCGGIASDPQAVPFLLGLGVDELSCSIPAVPEIKAVVRSVSLEQCRELASRAVEASTAAEVRALNPLPEA